MPVMPVAGGAVMRGPFACGAIGTVAIGSGYRVMKEDRVLQRGSEPDPHGGGPVLLAGEPLESATGAIIAVHGRGANPEDISALAEAVAPSGVAILAPAASG